MSLPSPIFFIKGGFAPRFQMKSLSNCNPLPNTCPYLPILVGSIVVTSVAYKFRRVFIMKCHQIFYYLPFRSKWCLPHPFSWAPSFYVFFRWLGTEQINIRIRAKSIIILHGLANVKIQFSVLHSRKYALNAVNAVTYIYKIVALYKGLSYI